MSDQVVATGLVAEEPSQLLGEDAWTVFVLDPFPGSPGARLAHACEVVCRSQEMATPGPRDRPTGRSGGGDRAARDGEGRWSDRGRPQRRPRVDQGDRVSVL